MVRAMGALLVLMTATATARAEEALPSPPTDPTAEERAFSAELERFARLRAFTERLMAKREAEVFEQAALRQARGAKLKRELTEREAAMSEREFDEAVALYLKKRQLTLALAAARAKAAPSSPATPPPTPLLPSSP